jgi:acetyl-CoA carboxylase biotin carboxyl carrier protein
MASASRPRAVRRDDAERPAAASAEASPSMDLDFVRGLIEAVDNSSIDFLELNRAGTKIRISKTPPAAPVMAGAAAPIMQAAAAATPAAAAPTPAAPEPAAAPAVSNLTDVKSPMVGTFYRQPAPEAPPYVEIGSVVKKGQTLCILEAMKLMNELECEVDGTIREILVENSDPVEYGQVLFRIEPS